MRRLRTFFIGGLLVLAAACSNTTTADDARNDGIEPNWDQAKFRNAADAYANPFIARDSASGAIFGGVICIVLDCRPGDTINAMQLGSLAGWSSPKYPGAQAKSATDKLSRAELSRANAIAKAETKNMKNLLFTAKALVRSQNDDIERVLTVAALPTQTNWIVTNQIGVLSDDLTILRLSQTLFESRRRDLRTAINAFADSGYETKALDSSLAEQNVLAEALSSLLDGMAENISTIPTNLMSKSRNSRGPTTVPKRLRIAASGKGKDT